MHKPNLRKIIIPEQGHFLIEFDLSGADAQVVAWEAEDYILMNAFRNGLKVHLVNGEMLYGEKITNKDPRYLKVKRGVHLTNYGGSAPTAADAMGCSLAEAIEFQRKWFDIHPAIVGWHMKVRNTLQRNRTMVTKWGRKVTYHGRCDDNMWRDALAFVPQSTVADTINRGLINVYENMKGRVRVKSQIHDSLLLQVKDCEYKEDIIKEIERNMLIPIPYTEPLIIPVEAKMSYKSWGDCEKIQVI